MALHRAQARILGPEGSWATRMKRTVHLNRDIASYRQGTADSGYQEGCLLAAVTAGDVRTNNYRRLWHTTDDATLASRSSRQPAREP